MARTVAPERISSRAATGGEVDDGERRDRIAAAAARCFARWGYSRTRMEELAYQRWDGDRIVEENFFYDPAQLVPDRR